VAPVALDWETIELEPETKASDALGLSAEDRAALGLSLPRTADLVPHLGGDAHAALADVLSRGAAYGKSHKPAHRR
jgi:hypothetical protein